MLLGSECTSLMRAGDPFETGSEKRGELWITDLCPSCIKCDSQYRVKRQAEFFSLYFNLLKDINLYDTSIVLARHEDLKKHCMPEQAGCARVPEEDTEEYNKLLNTVGYLLQEYITTVHMWNYAISINNNDTRISAPPEDGCGLLMQTKRALTDCSGGKKLKCTITLTQAAGQENLSVFVPSPVCKFDPFDYEPDVHFQITHNDYTSKKVEIEFGPLAVAGTCIVTAKFLPFVYAEMKSGVNDPTTSGGVAGMGEIMSYYDGLTSSVGSGGLFIFPDNNNGSGGSGGEITQETQGTSAQGSGGTVTDRDVGTLSIGVTTEISRLLEPTENDYNTGKRYPSISANGNNSWTIEIKWETLPDAVEMTDTYFFSTPQCREPAPDAVTKDTAFIDASSSEESEEQQS